MASKKSNVLRPNKKFSYYLIVAGVLLTLIYTPWMSKDSLAIPKQTILFIAAMYFFPHIIFNIKEISRLKFGKILITLVGLLLLHLMLVMVMSGVPIEQQIYGRDGRLLGFITFFSLAVLLISSIKYFNLLNLRLILKGLFFSGIPVCLYAISQSFGFDFFKWESRTNMVVSTLGNPNYVSAFSAMILIPILIYVEDFKLKKIFQIWFIFLILFTIYRSESIQGYLALLLIASTYILVVVIYKFKNYLYYFVGLVTTIFIFVISGTLGHGPLSQFLYKVSVQARGDFWRTAFNAANDNPIFGVGLDSFGEDYYYYRDQVAADHFFAEYSDSAHNYLLDYAAFGGYPLMIINFGLIIFTIYMYIRLQVNLKGINREVLSLFASWVGMQATFLISPLSLPMLYWSTVLSGAICGLALRSMNPGSALNRDISDAVDDPKLVLMPLSAVLAFLVMIPLINVDRDYLNALNSRNITEEIKLLDRFPRSTQKFAAIARKLHESGEYKYALDVARRAVDFNAKNVVAHAVIMINPIAPFDERVEAKKQALIRDPFNKIIPQFEILE